MRKWIVLLALLCAINGVGTICRAQNRLDRRIYLWDVTLSMKGKGAKATPNIYGDVVDFLVGDINSLTDPSTDIVVMPFQTSVLETWQAKATEEGKKSIIGKIKGYNNNMMTNTDIAGPINTVKSSHIDSSKRNMLILLTDGEQSAQFGGNEVLLKSIKSWQEYAQINDAYLVYVMLTDAAVNDDIKSEADRQERVSVVTPPFAGEFVELRPVCRGFNIKDDKMLEITFTNNKNISIPDGVEVSVRSDADSPIAVNIVAKISNGCISVAPAYDYETLKTQIPEVSGMRLALKVENGDEIKGVTGKIVLLSPSSVTAELINKREKTLTIKMKQ